MTSVDDVHAQQTPPHVGGTSLTSFDLDCDLREFVEIFWSTAEFHSTFVTANIEEKVLSVSEWKDDSIVDKDNDVTTIRYNRTINTNHPLPITLPWLPLYVTNKLNQMIKISYTFNNNASNNDANNNKVKRKKFFKFEIYEKSIIDGIPLVQPKVCHDWVIQEHPLHEEKINIKIYLWFEDQNISTFDVISPLVELHSSAELSKYFKLWQDSALEAITKYRENNKNNINDNPFPKTHENLKKVIDVLDELGHIELDCGSPSPRNSPRRRRNTQQIEVEQNSSHLHLLNMFFALSVCVLFAKSIDSTFRVAISMLLKRIEKITILYYFVRIIGSLLLGVIGGVFCHYLKQKMETSVESKGVQSILTNSNDENMKECNNKLTEDAVTITTPDSKNYEAIKSEPSSTLTAIDAILFPVNFFTSFSTPNPKHNIEPPKNELTDSLLPLNYEAAVNNN